METEQYRKHSLGRRAFLLFFLRRIKLPLFFALLDVIAWYVAPLLPVEYVPLGILVAQVGLAVAAGVTLIMLLLAWMEYRVHTFSFTEEAFLITSGLGVRKEMAALYHQIQNVSINRSPMNRMIGVSELVIFMTGADRDSGGHATIVLPAIGRKKARLVQKELLVRARRHFGRDARDGRDGQAASSQL